jgi:hypothetical protein
LELNEQRRNFAQSVIGKLQSPKFKRHPTYRAARVCAKQFTQIYCGQHSRVIDLECRLA